MKPSFHPRLAGVSAVLGALGATCSFTISAHGAPAKPAPTSVLGERALDVIHSVQWIPSGSASARRLFVTRRPRSDPTIARMVHAGDRIARLPYVWGGGHGSFDAAGYDCSGSVSYVLHGGGLLSTPQDSSGLESYGVPGPGRHVTVYANSQHALVVIDGRRFDTIALQQTGTRWSSSVGSTDGYTVRHPAGL